MKAPVGELSPEMLIGLMSQDRDSGDDARVMDAIVSRMTDRTIARFVSKNVIADGGTPTDRLAQAFQTLVQNPDERERLLSLAHDDVAESPLGGAEGFETVWNHVAQKLLTSYSDDFENPAKCRPTSSLRLRTTCDCHPAR